MKFTLFSDSATALVDLPVDLLVIPLAQGNFKESEVFALLDARLDGLLSRIVEEERWKGKSLQMLQLHTHARVSAKRLLLVGLGDKGEPQELRHAAAKATKSVRSVGATTMAIALPAAHASALGVQHTAEGVLLGRYRFDRYLSSDESKRPETLEEVTLAVTGGAAELEAAVRRAEIVAGAIARARDLVNEPAAEATPTRMAREAEMLAEQHGMRVEVLGPEKCRELGMGMFLAVAQGSDEEPRFVHLSYTPKNPPTKRVVLIGKGVTFDSGGLSLKPSASMEDMKVDMAGAAAVISAMGALAQLDTPVEVHALAACTENMPSGKAYKLGDVLKSMNGKTVEINNTDAEGRLTLGDAITYALRLEPDEIFDFATLTGACMVALGPSIAGVMSNNPGLSARFLDAAKSAGEEMWQLPLPERLRDQLKSDVADMKNTGERNGGALTAGIFLKEFVGDVPWVHVDIAGPASADKEYGAIPKGGTGFAVATIVEYLTR